MVLALLGTPSAFSSWTLHLLQAMLRRAYGGVQIIPVVFIKDLRAAWGERNERAVVIFSEGRTSGRPG